MWPCSSGPTTSSGRRWGFSEPSWGSDNPPDALHEPALEWLIDEPTFEALFQQEAEAQSTRELTLTHMVDIMLDVASGMRPSPRAAFRARWEQIRVSEAAFYGKLRRMEPDIAAAVVRHTAAQARAVIAAAEGLTDEPIPGYHARVLDGNALAGTEHRIQPL